MKKEKLPQIRDLNNRNFCASFFKLFLASSASSLDIPSLNFFGSPSISSLASLSARLVKALNGFNRRNPRVTRNLINHNIELRFSSTAAGASAPAPGAATTAAGAKEAAVTPSLSWRYSTSFCASARVRFEISSPSSTTFPSATAATGRRNVDRWESLGVRRGNSRVVWGEKDCGRCCLSGGGVGRVREGAQSNCKRREDH
ncbi:unnamed protein product [Lactuca virosa]|uniref:Uncharacterized protein n=1 Tax=Lactuca virosa TaxID=75947 RepID=A0AAU9NIS5_9ASTR|nr:unnamed protein product [Lactuca virosa]